MDSPSKWDTTQSTKKRALQIFLWPPMVEERVMQLKLLLKKECLKKLLPFFNRLNLWKQIEKYQDLKNK